MGLYDNNRYRDALMRQKKLTPMGRAWESPNMWLQMAEKFLTPTPRGQSPLAQGVGALSAGFQGRDFDNQRLMAGYNAYETLGKSEREREQREEWEAQFKPTIDTVSGIFPTAGGMTRKRPGSLMAERIGQPAADAAYLLGPEKGPLFAAQTGASQEAALAATAAKRGGYDLKEVTNPDGTKSWKYFPKMPRAGGPIDAMDPTGAAQDPATLGLIQGTGFPAQQANFMVRYAQAMRDGGAGLTDRDHDMYSYLHEKAKLEKRETLGDGRVITVPGHPMTGFPEPRKGSNKTPAPGGELPVKGARQVGTKTESGEMASRKGLVAEVFTLDAVPRLRAGLINPDGTMNTIAVTKMMAGTPGEGRDLRKVYDIMEKNRVRIESGATITPAEIAEQAKVYLPKPWWSISELNDTLNGMDTYYSAMGKSMNVERPERKAPAVPEGIPEGSVKTGRTHKITGRPVWRDGKGGLWVED